MCLPDGTNTATSTGRFTFNIFASLAEFEREIIKKRTQAGLVAAKPCGKAAGRPKGLSQVAIEKARVPKILEQHYCFKHELTINLIHEKFLIKIYLHNFK